MQSSNTMSFATNLQLLLSFLSIVLSKVRMEVHLYMICSTYSGKPKGNRERDF